MDLHKGHLKLFRSNQSYSFGESIIGTIKITGNHITLDGCNFTLHGSGAPILAANNVL
jgi:hypothetical protein